MPRYETIEVTPQLAKQWLGKNAENNRLPKKSRVPAYARDMINGDWDSDTGETIKFDLEGELIDGQNRLTAVVMAGVPITFDVAFDVPRRAMHVIDTGASRTGGDTLRIAGATDVNRASAVVRWVIQWDTKNFTGNSSILSPTVSEILHRYQQESGAFAAATARGSDCSQRSLGVATPAAVAYYLFSRIDQEETHQFFDQYLSGADLPSRSAVLALRNRMIRVRADRLTRPEQLAMFVRAWNAVREGRPMDRLQIARGELSNANFPQPR